MKTWLLWLLVLDANTGDLLDSHSEGDPKTAIECLKDRDGRVSKTEDGRVTVYVCENMQQHSDIKI